MSTHTTLSFRGRLVALLSFVALVLGVVPGTAVAIGDADTTCLDENAASVAITFGDFTQRAATRSLVYEVRTRLFGAKLPSKNLMTSSTALPGPLLLDTAGLPDLCLNWSLYGYPNGEGQDATGAGGLPYGRPYAEQYLADTVQVFVPGDSGVVDLAALIRPLTDPGCDWQADLYIGETLGDDEQGAPHGPTGPESPAGGLRSDVLLAYTVSYNDPAVPCGSAPATASAECTPADEPQINATVAGTTESGLYELEVDGVVVDSNDLVIDLGLPAQDVQLTAVVAPGPRDVRVLLNGEPLVTNGPAGERILAPGDDGTAVVDAPTCVVADAGLGDTVFVDTNGDGVQGDPTDEPGAEGVVVRLLDCSDTVLESTLTGPTGYYEFTGLLPGCYRVQFLAPVGVPFTVQGAGGDPALDSNADRTTGITGDVDLDPGEFDPTIDAGLVSAAVDIVKTTYIPTSTTGSDICIASNGEKARPVRLVLEYVGDTTTIIAEQDKASASGSVGPLPVTVVSLDSRTVVADGDIAAIGDRIELTGDQTKHGKIGSNTVLEVGGQTVEFHTSCSQPINLGDQYGSLRLVEFENRFGDTGSLGTTPEYGIDGATGTPGQPVTWFYRVTTPGPLSLANVVVTDDNGTAADTTDDFPATYVDGDDGDGLLAPGETWVFSAAGTVQAGRYDNVGVVTADGIGADGDLLVPGVTAMDPSFYTGGPDTPGSPPGADVCDTTGKPTAITLVYTGANTISTSQDPDKVGVTPASIAAPDPAYIVVNGGNKPTSGSYFSGSVPLGGEFTAATSTAGTDKFPSNTIVRIYDAPDGTLLQTIEFHTSCSQPLAIGDEFGNVELIGIVGKDGSAGTPGTPQPQPGSGGTPGTPAGGLDVDKVEVKDKDVKVEFENTGGDVTVEKVAVTWPTSNSGLKELKFDGEKLHTGDHTGGSFTWHITRTISAGDDTKVELKFRDKTIAGSGYTITLHLSDGSTVDVSV